MISRGDRNPSNANPLLRVSETKGERRPVIPRSASPSSGVVRERIPTAVSVRDRRNARPLDRRQRGQQWAVGQSTKGTMEGVV